MKILLLLNRVPFPLNDGGAIGTFQFVKGYATAGAAVTCLAMNTAKHFVDEATIQKEFSFTKQFKTIFIDNRIRPLPALFNLFSDKSYILSRFDSASYREALIAILQQNNFDIVHIDGLPGGIYIDTIRKYSSAKIVQRAHNVEHLIWERAAMSDRNIIKQWYVKLQAERLKKEELKTMQSVDLVLSISEEDDHFIQTWDTAVNTKIVPAGLDIVDDIKLTNISAPLDLFFIGSFDWLPNTQGIDWFLKHHWDAIHERFPTLKFYIAGKKMPEQMKSLSKNICAIGEVASAQDFISHHQLMLVPLISGSGVRIKLLEAFAQGKCVLATAIAVEGSYANDGKEILLAETTADFCNQIQRIIDNPSLLNDIGSAAFRLVKERFDNTKNMQDLVAYYQKICLS